MFYHVRDFLFFAVLGMDVGQRDQPLLPDGHLKKDSFDETSSEEMSSHEMSLKIKSFDAISLFLTAPRVLF